MKKFDHLEEYSITEASDRNQELLESVRRHNYNYHTLGQPTISDYDYDMLFAELQSIELKWPELKDPNSPTCRVGSPVMSTFTKVNHRKKMLSLENSYSAKEVCKFFKDTDEVVIEPKFDGLSLSLTYVKGELTMAVTRGDGSTGDDVTQNARAIKSIPLVLPFPISCEVRGEVYMPVPVYHALNTVLSVNGEELLANPRNAAAGTLKSKDSRVVAARGLAFVAYNAVSPDLLINALADLEDDGSAEHTSIYDQTHESLILCLTRLSFVTPISIKNTDGSTCSMMRVVKPEAKGIDAQIAELDILRQKLPVQTDGLVIKINSLSKQNDMGEGTRAPNWATAYKYPPESKDTILKDIEVSLGRFGTLTPVAILEPVQLSGTTVQRASLCNQDEVERLGINIGDLVSVVKSAEIIPKVCGLKEKRSDGYWKMPTNCPCCGTPVEKVEGQVAYRCKNKTGCTAQIAERLKHTLGKSGLDWDGFGIEMINVAIEAGIVSLSMIMRMEDTVVDTVFKKAFAKKFKAERERVKTVPLWRKIHSLGVQGLGSSLSKDLCAKWSSLADMIDNIGEVPGIIGDVFAANFCDYLVENGNELDDLESSGFLFSENKDRTGPLSGFTFCITGSLKSGSREDMSARIEKAGGTVKSTVSKKVNYLLLGYGGGAGKAEGAQKHGTVVVTEEQVYAMMGIPMEAARRSYEEPE